ncbi:MAG: J domain-containing protein [Magnetococcales bacterium]|nr:J domain-containing protein [Magnetococcales bacterium]
MAKPGLYARITAARELLGLAEEATLEQINSQAKTLLKKWHPDTCRDELERCEEMTRELLAAAKLLRDYCAHYRYSFRVEEVEKYLSPEEWWFNRFGQDPVWSSDKQDPLANTPRPQVRRGR